MRLHRIFLMRTGSGASGSGTPRTRSGATGRVAKPVKAARTRRGSIEDMAAEAVGPGRDAPTEATPPAQDVFVPEEV